MPEEGESLIRYRSVRQYYCYTGTCGTVTICVLSLISVAILVTILLLETERSNPPLTALIPLLIILLILKTVLIFLCRCKCRECMDVDAVDHGNQQA